jgi:hypothetical protein
MKRFKPGKLPPVRNQQCETCVFKPVSEGGIDLTSGRHAEIQVSLLTGSNQLCHHDNDKTICRGGREFQLQYWHRMGVIAEPTDEALQAAMERTMRDVRNV